ncbi:hypothetical protein IAQ61_009228 [Plenodomus lingam]|uniref:uncharacterized protein n=1 Tax=Leptosphaeria maculans TaxID=5022 RepID=UPI00331CFCB4|nr:hypothetical protein IAQ61_009228 [Plenodomus lingam]
MAQASGPAPMSGHYYAVALGHCDALPHIHLPSNVERPKALVPGWMQPGRRTSSYLRRARPAIRAFTDDPSPSQLDSQGA